MYLNLLFCKLGSEFDWEYIVLIDMTYKLKVCY